MKNIQHVSGEAYFATEGLNKVSFYPNGVIESVVPPSHFKGDFYVLSDGTFEAVENRRVTRKGKKLKRSLYGTLSRLSNGKLLLWVCIDENAFTCPTAVLLKEAKTLLS